MHAEMPPTGARLVVVGLREPVTFRNAGVCRRPGTILGCGATILWCTTSAGGAIPIDVVPLADGRYESHFASCPDASRFRKG